MGRPPGSKVQLRGWERLLLVLFAAVILIPADFDPSGLAIAVRAAGWLVVIAALGVVEVLMALYYRTKRSLAARRHR